MNAFYFIVQFIDNRRVVFRDRYFDSLKSNSQGYLYYKCKN